MLNRSDCLLSTCKVSSQCRLAKCMMKKVVATKGSARERGNRTCEPAGDSSGSGNWVAPTASAEAKVVGDVLSQVRRNHARQHKPGPRRHRFASSAVQRHGALAGFAPLTPATPADTLATPLDPALAASIGLHRARRCNLVRALQQPPLEQQSNTVGLRLEQPTSTKASMPK